MVGALPLCYNLVLFVNNLNDVIVTRKQSVPIDGTTMAMVQYLIHQDESVWMRLKASGCDEEL